MIIQQKSFCTFLLKSKNSEVIINPTSKVENSLVLVSNTEIKEVIHESDASNLTINSAGEFEAKDVFIFAKKIKNHPSILYKVNVENLSIGVISFVSSLEDFPVDFFEDCDIILVGAGDGNTFLNLKDADHIIQQISPNIAIMFGFKDQLGKSMVLNLSTLEELKTTNPKVQLAEKVLKVEKEVIENSDTTELYYFEV